MKMFCVIKVVIFLGCLSAASGFAADTISGKVSNQTTNRPAAGDEVILLRLGEGMEEAARTRTDAQGAFSLPVAMAGAQHFVRVLHQGVNYDQRVVGAAPLEIAVYDVVAQVPGLTGSMGIVQVESDGELLKVTEMYAIINASSPPVTQAGPSNYVFTLPAKATLDSFENRKAGGAWVNGTAAPVQGQPGRYAVDFPLRPGETHFKYVYHLPYAGPVTLRLKVTYPIKNFAVVHPPSMSFKALRPQAFASVGLVQGLQLEQAVSQPVVREVPAFEVSGIGTAPRTEARAKTAPPSSSLPMAPARMAAANPAAAGPATAPENSNDEMWAIGSGLAALFAAGVFAAWRRRQMLAAATSAKGKP
ncbi:MAG: carboxypeptidase-like regulatory domain-containing protein [Acidobacteriia bacterium]|nr:carboxypeptidase-like regulatory domain-containing protein [Terriglobia bacterium]